MTLTDPQYKTLLDAQAVTQKLAGERQFRFEAMEALGKLKALLAQVAKHEQRIEEAVAPF